MKRVTSLLLLLMFMASTALISQVNSVTNVLERPQPQAEKPILDKQLFNPADVAERRQQVQSDATGDIVFNLDVETICGDNQLLGCDFDGTYLWITGAGNAANPNYIYQVDPVAGTLVNTYEQGTTTAWGMRDLAWVEADGLLYAGDEDGFYSIDPTDGTVTTVFAPTGMGVIRALAYDGTHFWTKSFGDDLYQFDIAGNIINTYSPTVADACYGAAYDWNEGFLYLFSQDDAMFYQFDLAGNHTGVTYDVSAAQAGGISGGAFFDYGQLYPGLATLSFLLQGTPDVVASMDLYPTFEFAVDVGIQAITEPVSGVELTASEPITITLRNYGSISQSNIPYEVDWGTADETYNGEYAGSLAPGEEVSITLPVTADLSSYGNYTFTACTQLANDEAPGNDCATKTITNSEPSLCVDNLYTSGCTFGDGLVYWDLANINIPDIPCEGTPAWYHDYTDQIHNLPPGAYTLTVQGGYSGQYFDVWIDFNDDLIYSEDELVLDDANCPNANTNYQFTITIPPDAPAGQHYMRFRTNWPGEVTDPCETLTYGNCADFIVDTEGVPCLVECPPEGIDEGEPCGDDVNGGCNMETPAFTPISDGDIICGTAWADGDTRDTDWFEVTVAGISTLTFEVTAEFEVILGMIEQTDPGVPGCDNITGSLDPYYTAAPCEAGTLEISVPPGTYYLFVAPAAFNGIPCTADYIDYIAELTVASPETGVLTGITYDAPSGGALGGVLVEAGLFSAISGPGPFNAGKYSMIIPTGTYDVTASKAEYHPETVTDFEVVAGANPLNFYLNPVIAPELLSATPGPGSITLEWEPIAPEIDAIPAGNVNTSAWKAPKKPGTAAPSIPNPEMIRQGGDDIATATVIPSIPYTDTGTTDGYTDDYDEVCPYPGEAPDVVYSYTPATDVVVTIDLCASLYDTKVFVYENAATPGAPYACNEDACGDDGFKSQIMGLGLTGGNTYYIVVDGYESEAGEYTLVIEEFEECVIECPGGAIAEGEVCPGDEYVDNYNGGCNSEPPVYQPINCGDIICGTASTFIFTDPATGDPLNYRDTDWYSITLDEPTLLTWSGMAEFPLLLYVLDDPADCESFTIAESITAAPCEEAMITIELAPGTYWLFVGPSVFEGYPCGGSNDYYVSLTCEPLVVETSFNIYRDGALYEEGIMGTTFVDENFPSFGDEYCYEVSQIMPDLTESDLSNTLCASPEALPGATCEDPYSITEIPFEGIGFTTEGFGDDYSSADACESSYMNGDDFVFSFTPAEDIDISVTLTNTGTWVGVFITEGCPDVGTCIEYATSSSGNPVLESAMLTAGVEYFIIVSTWPAPQFTAFDILVEENIDGILSGTVIGPDIDGPVEGVTITADQLRESFTTTTGPDGTYELSLPIGTYDVTAEKDGYIPQTVEGILIEEGVSVEQNFMLEFAPPVLLSAEPSFFDITLTWEGNPVFNYGKGRKGEVVTASNEMKVFNPVQKVEPIHGPTKIIPQEMGRAIGDDCTDPIIVDALPYTDVNTTCGHLNTYEETCLGVYDGGEDIVYELTLTEAKDIEIDLQTTTSWTGVLITAECPIGENCIDYVTGLDGNKNLIVSLEAGTYYIMIDTWPAPDCIEDFTLTIEEVLPCILECPPEGIPEGEICPPDDYVDTYNGGCNSEPPIFQTVNCGDVICGTASTYMFEGTARRDTDWYEITVDSPKTLTLTVTAEFPVVAGLIEQFDPGVPGCDNITGSISPAALADPCDDAIVEVTLIPGTYYFFIGPDAFEGYPCGTDNDYIASFECTDTFISYYEVYRDDQIDPIATVYDNMYVDEDVMPGNTYCYEVIQVATPSIVLGPSNELCAEVPYPPQIVVDPTSLSELLNIGETSTQYLTIENPGLGDLDWSASIDFTAKDGISYVKDIPATGTINNENTDICENRQQITSDATGDIVFSLDVEALCGDDQLLGVEFDGTYLWITGAGNNANPNYIYQIDPIAGTLVNTFEQGTTSDWGMRDLVWVEADGLLYSGDDDGFYSIDPTDGTVSTIFTPTGMGVIRALAYDGTNFWTKSFGGDLFEFDLAGNIINTYSPTVASSCYGAAYDHTEGFLYLFSQDDAMFYQFGLDGIHTGVTYDVSAAQLDGIAGGAFYDFGTLVPGKATLGFLLQGTPDMVGAMELYPSTTPWLSIDPTSGTIAPEGSEVMDVMFNATEVENGVYNAEINISSNDPINPTVTVPVQLIVGGMTQNITMPMGWNGWSSYINPDARMGMEEMMMPVIDDMIITLYFNEIYYPLYGINSIGDFTNAHGYISKMAAEATLPVEGFMADPTVELMEGWNLMPVLQECPIASDDVFGDIPEVIIAFEVAGNGIYYPLYGVSTIGDLMPGKAYYVKVSADASYTFPGCLKSGSYGYPAPLRPENGTSWNNVNYTGTAHAVVFTENAVGGLLPGDIIGAFNSTGVCVGMTPVTGSTASFNMFGVDVTTASADGYVEGETLSFRVYRPETDEQYDLEVVYSSTAPNSNGLFAVNGASVVTDLTMTATSVGTSSLSGISVYPNPSDGIFNISVNDLEGQITYTVVNAQGQDVYSGNLLESQEIDLSAEPKGIYFIKFMNEKVLRIEKLVIK